MTDYTKLIERVCVYEQDHAPDGWPAIKMRDVSTLADAIEALQAENERLKALPMKYKRMEFNAQLQEENAALRAKLDAMGKGERSSLDSVLMAVSAAYEALEDHAEYKIAPGEAHTIPVNEKARIRDKAGEAIDTLQYLLREALEAPNAQHPDDIAVDKFAAAMKAKMSKQRAKGYSGWDDKEDCPTERLQQMLADHIAKGDAVDVGNFAMMLWNRGEGTAAPKALEPQPDDSDVNQVHEGNAQVTYAPIFYGASAPKEPTP